MGESKFRLIYDKSDDRNYLVDANVSEISFNGEPLTGVTDIKFHATPGGLSRLVLEMYVTDIEIEGPAEIEIKSQPKPQGGSE